MRLERRDAFTAILTDVRRNEERELVLRFDELPCGDAMRSALLDRFEQLCSGGGTWSTRSTVHAGFNHLKRFLNFAEVDEPRNLRGSHWRAWIMSLSHASRSTVAAPVKTLLKGIPDITDSVLRALYDTELKRRPHGEGPERILEEAEIEELRRDAFRTLRSANDRITSGWEFVEEFANALISPDHPDYRYAATLHEIASTGDIAQRFPSNEAARVLPVEVRQRLWGSSKRLSPMPVYEALYPTADEIASALIALVITCGWNLSVARDINVSDIERADARDGTEPTILLVTLMKPRRGAEDTWTESYSDTGARSKARLIMLIQQITEGARRTLADIGHESDSLLISLGQGLNGMHHSPSGTLLFPISAVDHRTVMTYLARWRKKRPQLAFATPKVIRHYFVTQEHPQGHGLDVNTDYALRNPNVQRDAQVTIAEGITAALAQVEARVIKSDTATAHDAPTAALAGSLTEVNEGLNDTVGAACQDPDHHPATGALCRSSLLLCFACKNAVVMRRHLRRVFALHMRLDVLRTTVDDTTWRQRFAPHYKRLTDLLTEGNYFSAGELTQARIAVTDSDLTVAQRLLNREWDVE